MTSIESKTSLLPQGDTKGVTSVHDKRPKTFEEQVADLMEDQNHKLQLEDSRREIILILGRTGVGKSTMAEIIFGDVSALEATFDEELLCVKIKNTKETSGYDDRSMFQSDTICPQLFKDPTKPGLAIYDCPGFADTRGTSNEIATGVYLSKIVRHAKRVKLVVVVDYDTVKPNADRNRFTDGILPEVLDLVLTTDIYQGGVFLLVTKYANPLDPNNQFADDVIIRSIAKFLKEAQKHAIQGSEDGDRKSAIDVLFGKSWLKTLDGTNYPNIGFSRSIVSEGKLTNMESATRQAKIRTQLLKNPNFLFKPSNRKDFGCPISEAAKLEIRTVIGSLAHEVEELLMKVGKKVVNKFIDAAKSREQLSTFVSEYNYFLTGTKNLTNEAGMSSESLEVLRKFGNNIDADIGDDMDKLNNVVKRLKFLSDVDVEESSAIREDVDAKLNKAMMSMSKDQIIEFRSVQKNLAVEFDQMLNLLVPRVVKKIAQSSGNSFFVHFNTFARNLETLSNPPHLSHGKLETLRKLGNNIGEEMVKELHTLAGIISCLKCLTAVDTEQSSETWADIHLKWDHAMELMKKEVAQLKAGREYAEAETRRQLAAGKAAADLAAVRVAAQRAAASAAADLAAARTAEERAKAGGHEQLVSVQRERDIAAANAQAEIAEANRRAAVAAGAIPRKRGLLLKRL